MKATTFLAFFAFVSNVLASATPVHEYLKDVKLHALLALKAYDEVLEGQDLKFDVRYKLINWNVARNPEKFQEVVDQVLDAVEQRYNALVEIFGDKVPSDQLIKLAADAFKFHRLTVYLDHHLLGHLVEESIFEIVTAAPSAGVSQANKSGGKSLGFTAKTTELKNRIHELVTLAALVKHLDEEAVDRILTGANLEVVGDLTAKKRTIVYKLSKETIKKFIIASDSTKPDAQENEENQQGNRDGNLAKSEYGVLFWTGAAVVAASFAAVGAFFIRRRYESDTDEIEAEAEAEV